MPPFRFPPPWTVEETDACFIVRDANGKIVGMRSIAASSANSSSNSIDTGKPD